jgi:hypothetical protein
MAVSITVGKVIATAWSSFQSPLNQEFAMYREKEALRICPAIMFRVRSSSELGGEWLLQRNLLIQMFCD